MDPGQFPRPFALSPGGRLPLPGSVRWPGGPGEGSTSVPSCHHCHSRTSFSVSLCGGRGPERARIWPLLSLCPTPRPHPTPQGLSLVPCPQDSGPSLTKEPAHVGEQTQVVYSSFLSCHPAVSPHLHANKTQRNQEPVRGGAVGVAHPALPQRGSEHSLSVLPPLRGWEPAWEYP